MASLGVAFFVSFHELEPSRQQQCIFFTKQGARCKNRCEAEDNKEAITLHNVLARSIVNLEDIRRYILCNCCRRSLHRDRVEDTSLLMPLALRWYEEILDYDFKRSGSVNYAVAFGGTASESARTCKTKATANTGMTIQELLETDRSSPAPWPPELQQRYNLRSREVNMSTKSTSAEIDLGPCIYQSPLSEFRPHIATPLREDSVFQKLIDPLQNRDFESGSLYIFDRASSPGHVKIGWTAKSVSGRLESWSKCGYIPNLLFEVSFIPHAQRVETLTHRELIKEWRRERMCKAPHCRKSHQEWFEIDRQRAIQVLNDWAQFMKSAVPYESDGSLKKNWKDKISMVDGGGVSVTAKGLLEHFELSLMNKLTPLESQKDKGAVSNSEAELQFANELNPIGLEVSKEPSLSKRIQPIRQPTLDVEIPIHKTGLLSKQLATAEVSPLTDENSLEKVSFVDKKPVPTSKTGSQTETLAHPNVHKEPILQKSSFAAGLRNERYPLPKSKSGQEDVLLPGRYRIKEVVPQIRLPSPPLQSTSVTEDETSPQAKQTPCSRKAKSQTINVITELDSDRILADTKLPCVLSTVPVLRPAMAVLPATSSENIDRETVIDILPLDISSPLPKPDLLESIFSSTLSESQVNIASTSSAQLDTEALEMVTMHSSPMKEKEADLHSSVIEHQHIVERNEQKRTDSEAPVFDERLGEKEVKSGNNGSDDRLEMEMNREAKGQTQKKFPKS